MERKRRGISAKEANLIMASITLILSALLIVATYRATTGYSEMRTTTDHYIRWQQDAAELQVGSDYLTEQVRCFAETGKREYLDNYFVEANVTRRRDRAVENIRGFLGDAPAYQALVSAMGESVALMDREYYSMRLKIEACGDDLAAYPEVLRQVALSPEDAALPPAEKDALARSMVFDDIYHAKKEAIFANVHQCITALANVVDQQQTETADRFSALLAHQRLLIAVTILMTVLMLLVTLLLIVAPLLRSTRFIREEKPLPVTGSKEFRFLAETYNTMFEMNRQQKAQLAFEATHDKLTGVYNRNGYDMIQRNTDWSTAALVLFDLDRFKPINDTYGHKTGDLVLQRAAKAISNAFRAQDYVCRIGGDEFAVIMVRTDKSSAELIRDKVRAINESLSGEKDGVPAVQVSCGVTYGELIQDFDRLFHEADAALYRVKHSGGSGCEVCV